MNALAHDFRVDFSPYESEEDAPELSVREEAALVAVIVVAIPTLVAASVLQVVYDALILLWVLLGLPLIRLLGRLHTSPRRASRRSGRGSAPHGRGAAVPASRRSRSRSTSSR